MLDLSNVILDGSDPSIEPVFKPLLNGTQVDRIFDDHGIDRECIEINWNEKLLGDRQAHDLFKTPNDPIALRVASLRGPFRRFTLVGHVTELLSCDWKTTASCWWNA